CAFALRCARATGTCATLPLLAAGGSVACHHPLREEVPA
ncbi:ABC transporter ATP-binding protein, partial [Micromonospora provocatoris]